MGLWIWNDGNRLAYHVAVAEKMIENGISEVDAMEQSGCNFWDAPWYRRLFQNYPQLPNQK